MASKNSKKLTTVTLNETEYVLKATPTKVGDETFDVVMTRWAIEPEISLPETADAEGMFTFIWGKSRAGTGVIPKIGNILIPAGSTRIGVTAERDEHVLDPLPREHEHGPWIGFSFYDSEGYAPFSHPDLYRKFARLSESENAILQFATRYGALGHSGYTMSPLDGKLVPNCKIESILHWRREIATMRRLLEIWDHAKNENVGELASRARWAIQTEGQDRPSRIIKWIEPSSGRDLYENPDAIIPYLGNEMLGFEGSSTKPMPSGWREGDVLEPAKAYVSINVNKKLAGHVDPRLDPFGEPDILLWPDCLLSAMYVQFGHEISGQTRPKIECRGCGRYFSPKHGSQHYCEPQCSQRKYWHEKGSERARDREHNRGVNNAETR